MKVRLAGLAVAALVIVAVSTAVVGAELSLLDAAESNDRAAAIAALKEGSDVNARGPDGTTALLWAAYNGDLELVQRLIRAGADVNAKNDFGAFALSEAAIAGSTPIIEALLDADADANAANPEGETPLMEVARTGNVQAAALLLDAGADIDAIEQWGGQSALMWAAAQRQPEMVKLLVAHGADVDARGVIRDWQRKIIKEPRPKDMNQGGFTPLLYAAREGCIECAKHLVAGGADLDLPDPHRVTPLNMALLNLHFDFAAYMIEAGADIEKWDLYGRTPLYLAADTNTLPVMGNGAMVVLPSTDAHTALDIARILLDAGANPNIQLKRRPPYRNVPQDRGGDSILSMGATPLLRAARAGDAPMVELLLEHGALVDLPSNQGVTPLMAAAGVEYGLRVTRGRNRTEEGVLATLKLLVDAGADVNARMVTEPKGDAAAHLLVIEQRLSDFSYDYRGRQVPSPRAVPHRTALHGAAMKGFDSIVEFLAANGADLNAKDANGRTPLDLAMGNYEEAFLRQSAEPHVETAELLKTLMAASSAQSE
ncbi:MAG TPA: ankyrin repeat domain-containing protein [Gammaproteobacteria bacterium]|nr:ankyrin repeat domain-containing protein [Gammaproteobacteria bacterium]